MTGNSQPSGPHDEPVILDEAYQRDPYPVLARLREAAPVHRVRLPNGMGRWLVTRYDAVVAALADPRLSNEVGRAVRTAAVPEPAPPRWRAAVRTDQLLGRAMVNLDPPEHTRLRRLVVRAFSARQLEALRPRIAWLTGQLLDEVAGKDELDLLSVLAARLPVTVICELLGVPTSDADMFRAAARVLGGFPNDDAAALAAIESMDVFDRYVRALIRQRRQHPGEDLFTQLVTVEEDGQRLTDDELVGMAGLLLFAGHETSVQLISTGVLTLLRHPAQLERVRADASLLPGTVEETLRYDGPVNPGMLRYAMTDVEIESVRIDAGSTIIVGTASANRDPARWPDPDRFDPGRGFPQRQLAFGHGLHYCLGARLAQIEGEIAIGEVLARYPRLRLAVPADRLRWRDGMIRCVEELPVRVD